MAREPSTLANAVRLLGVRKTVRSPLDLVPVIRKGLPLAALEAVARRAALTPMSTAESLGISRRTIARRKQKRERLDENESERVVRLARILAEVERVLGERGLAWLKRPCRALGGSVPLSMLDTDVGASAVLDELGRIDHGILA
jgi:putative toxin-antitoxin system antitoxin component (TIGR02293 family)